MVYVKMERRQWSRYRPPSSFVWEWRPTSAEHVEQMTREVLLPALMRILFPSTGMAIPSETGCILLRQTLSCRAPGSDVVIKQKERDFGGEREVQTGRRF